jgi:hypothetical protein
MPHRGVGAIRVGVEWGFDEAVFPNRQDARPCGPDARSGGASGAWGAVAGAFLGVLFGVAAWPKPQEAVGPLFIEPPPLVCPYPLMEPPPPRQTRTAPRDAGAWRERPMTPRDLAAPHVGVMMLAELEARRE